MNIDADAYDFAYAYAHGRGIPLGTAISELLRRAEQAPEQPIGEAGLRRNKYGYLVRAKTGRSLTPEMVKEYSEDPIE